VKRLVICEYFVSFVNLQQKKTTTTAIINGQSESTKKMIKQLPTAIINGQSESTKN
jgi:hypothetical protein